MRRKKRLFFIILGIIIVFFLFKSGEAKTVENSLIPTFAPSPTPKSTPTSTPTPTLTPTPTITPTPTFTGFCFESPVLMYHHVEDMARATTDGHAGLTVSPDIFDSQMAYLVNQGYRSLSAEELIGNLNSHVNSGKVVVVTLDDGYEDNYQNAFPVAKKYNIKLNIMLATGLLENPDFMTWSEVKEMADSGLVTFGNHSWSHYSLPNGDDTKINTEIKTAQQQIEEHLGYKPTYITWPWGSYDNRTIKAALDNGISAGFSTTPGTIQCDSFLWGLHRTRIGNSSLAAYGL